jgi:hypothetical protein
MDNLLIKGANGPHRSKAAGAGQRRARCQRVGERAARLSSHPAADGAARGLSAAQHRRWLQWTATVVFVLCGTVASAPAADAVVGIRLTYQVSFGRIPVGESYYSWVADPAGALWVSKEIVPAGPMARLYQVRDRFVARLRGQDGRAEALYEYIDEPKDRRQERWATIDWHAREVTLVRVNHTAGNTDRKVLSVVDGVQWPLTLPYWLSLQPLTAVDGLVVPLLDGSKLKEVRLAVRGQEKVKTELGRLRCDRIDGEAWYRGEAQRAGSFQAWRRSAEPRIPVRVISRLKFGTLHETVVAEEPYGAPPVVPAVPVDTTPSEN